MATRKYRANEKWDLLKRFIENEQKWCAEQEDRYHTEGDEKMALAYWSRNYQLEGVLEEMKRLANYVKLPWEK